MDHMCMQCLCVGSSLRDRTTKHTARLQWKDKDKQHVTDWARQFDIKWAIKRHAEILDGRRFLSYVTVGNLLPHYEKTDAYFSPSTRGGKRILSANKVEQVQDCCNKTVEDTIR